MLIQGPHSQNSLAHACPELPFFSLHIKRSQKDVLSLKNALSPPYPHTHPRGCCHLWLGEWDCLKTGRGEEQYSLRLKHKIRLILTALSTQVATEASICAERVINLPSHRALGKPLVVCGPSLLFLQCEDLEQRAQLGQKTRRKDIGGL